MFEAIVLEDIYLYSDNHDWPPRIMVRRGNSVFVKFDDHGSPVITKLIGVDYKYTTMNEAELHFWVRRLSPLESLGRVVGD